MKKKRRLTKNDRLISRMRLRKVKVSRKEEHDPVYSKFKSQLSRTLRNL